jgi:hypothetical protein
VLWRSRWAVLAVLLVAFGFAIWVAGQGGEPVQSPVQTGEQRLGPEAGEPVADYLRRAGASLPPAQSPPVWALVQLDSYLKPGAAADLTRDVQLSRVILRVPLPRVQTALISRDLPGRTAPNLTGMLIIRSMESVAQQRLAVSRAVPAGRREAVAAAEAAQLRSGCACVLALLVLGDGDHLRALSARPGVRAVHAAFPDTPIQDIAISPLLPEQLDIAGPVPDDGPVPS